MSYNEIVKIFLMTFTSFLFVMLVTPFIIKVANHVGALDIPNKRKVHTVPIPRLGGVGIFLGFLLGYMIYGTPSAIMNSVLIGSFIIVLTGVVDDIKPLDAKTKFIGQLIASLIIVFYGHLLINNLSAFNINIDFDWYISYPLTIFFILGCINCMNLIDGLDGLASGISCIYFFTVGLIAILKGSNGLDFILCFIMLGSSLGFLIHNYHPAKIFMGDSGSTFLGFIIGVVGLLGFKNITLTSFFIPFMIIAIPVLDTIFAILRRALKKQSIISTPDKFHIHHQLLNMNFSHKTTVIIIWIIDALFALASIIYVIVDNNLGYLIYGILLILVFIFVINTNVVFDFKKERISIFKKNH